MAVTGARPLVAVVGGGLSGLAAARSLASSGRVRVVILEASDRLGGKVAAGECAGRPVELGPDQFLRRDPSLEQLCRELGLEEDLVAPTGGGAGVWSHGRLRALPRGLVLGIPTDWDAVAESGIVSDAGVEAGRAAAAAAGGGPTITAAEVGLESGEERSAGAVLRPRLGDEVVDRLVDPLLGGINAASIDTLSLGTVAPQIARAVVGKGDIAGSLGGAPGAAPTIGPGTGSPFFGVRGGLARVVDALAAELRDLGVEVRTGSGVVAAELSGEAAPSDRPGGRVRVRCSDGTVLEPDALVLAVPGPQLAGILGGRGLHDHLGGHDQLAGPSGPVGGATAATAEAARSVDYAGVVVTTLAYPAAGLPPPTGWTGFLVPRVERRLMTAVTYLSDKWPWMGDESLRFVRVSAGRQGDERAASLDDGELVAALRTELEEIAGIDSEPVDVAVTRWPGAFPQYRPGYGELVRRMEGGLGAFPQIQLAGAVLGGIGMPACVTSGLRAAGRILDALGG